MQGLNPPKRWGATEEDWFLFGTMLGLERDLLPAVANPHAKISSGSAMKQLGKTPSVYNSDRTVRGISDWTNKVATKEWIEKWAKEPDYSICVRAERLKGIDCDITDKELSAQVDLFIRDFLDYNFEVWLPIRFRKGSPKFLMAFMCQEETLKRVIRLPGNQIIEFLGNRQQFLVAGTHTDGSRYEWSGLELEVPSLTVAQFDQLWSALEKEFAIEPSRTAKESKRMEVDADEPILKRLSERGMVKGRASDGSYNIECPFEHEHTTESVDTATVYWPAHTGGYAHASIKCLHGHCAHRTTEHFKLGLGFDLADGFEVISEQGAEDDWLSEALEKPQGFNFNLTPMLRFANDGTRSRYLLKDMIPMSALGVVYGPPSGGKTFMMLDLTCSIARGVEWRGKKVNQAHGIYVCAEGAFGFRKRVRAYQQVHKLTNESDLAVHVLDGNPNLMDKEVVKKLAAAIKALGIDIGWIVLDTYANCMTGDENKGEDVSKVIANCKWLMKELGCTVILVHHSGKDSSKGARGWSGLKGAVDFEFEVRKEQDVHILRNVKQKDGEDGAEYGFTLMPVDLGEDLDGEPQSSCVIAESKIVPLSMASKSRSDKINEREAVIFQYVQEVYEKVGSWPLLDVFKETVCNEFGLKPQEADKALSSLQDRGLLEVDFDGLLKLGGK